MERLTPPMVSKPTILLNDLLQNKVEDLHDKHKQVWGHRIPCRSPLAPLKNPCGDPLRQTENDGVVTHSSIHKINSGGKPNNLRTALRKSHSIVSYAFRMSTFKAHLGGRCCWLYPWKSSWARRMLLPMERPGTNAFCDGLMRSSKTPLNC
ncbi:UNVERIFIED_CONTAM: hypothetical protein Slati_3083900 [Sesamum latifolium]|uniref:Uncharacterized protein n=1 Tax=Sesamum latifolium TaxID=2727402 RepID=A0AAW2UT72_9LAMI